jgi:hypothetical protein
MAGASTILSDPIFQGLAVSTLFGAGVATAMALLVIPLGCISARKQFYVETFDDGTVGISPAYQRIEKISTESSAKPARTPLWMRLYGGVISAFTWVFYIFRALFTMLGMGFKALLGVFGRRGGGTPPPPPRQPTPGGTPPPPRGGTPPPPREAPPQPPPPTLAATESVASAAASQPAVKAVPAPPATPAPVPASAEAITAGDTAAASASDANHSGEEADEHGISSPELSDEDGQGVVRKRRGIRLKQDLN